MAIKWRLCQFVLKKTVQISSSDHHLCVLEIFNEQIQQTCSVAYNIYIIMQLCLSHALHKFNYAFFVAPKQKNESVALIKATHSK